MKTVTLRLRVEPELKKELLQAIKNGKDSSVSELIRTALNEFLKKKHGEELYPEPSI